MSKRRDVNRLPILVIEENADQWLLIRSALSKCFPEIGPVWLNNAGQSLLYLKKCLVNTINLLKLILLGLYEPSWEKGWSILKLIKPHDSYQRPPVVTLSASEDRPYVVIAYAPSIASCNSKSTTYTEWIACFYTFRRYWLETVAL